MILTLSEVMYLVIRQLETQVDGGKTSGTHRQQHHPWHTADQGNTRRSSLQQSLTTHQMLEFRIGREEHTALLNNIETGMGQVVIFELWSSICPDKYRVVLWRDDCYGFDSGSHRRRRSER